MDNNIYHAYLDEISKKKPFDVCRFCIKETIGLLNTTEFADFGILYTNITNLEVCLLLPKRKKKTVKVIVYYRFRCLKQSRI